MKRTLVIRELRKIARARDVSFQLLREGGGHEIWQLGEHRLVIPRHRDINEWVAKDMLKLARS